jgi:uncharacterized protein YqgC (DUF456 family)
VIGVLLVVLGALLVVAGVVGCLLPVLPGPPLAFGGLLLLWAERGGEAATFDGGTVLALGLATVGVTLLDLVTPLWGARRYGASRLGVWGSVAGMVVGAFAFPPLGMVLGAFAGAVAGELLDGKAAGPSLRAAWGVFVGTVVGILLKLLVTIAIAFVYVRELL